MMNDYLLFLHTDDFVEIDISNKYNLQFLDKCQIESYEKLNDYIDDNRLKIVVVRLSEEINSLEHRLPLIEDFQHADLIVIYSREEIFKDFSVIEKEIFESYNNKNLCVLAGGIDYRNYSDAYFFPILSHFKIAVMASDNSLYTQPSTRNFLFDCLLGTPKPARKYIFYRLKEDELLEKSLVSLTVAQDYYQTLEFNDLYFNVAADLEKKFGSVSSYQSSELRKLDAELDWDNKVKIQGEQTNFDLFVTIKDIIHDTNEGHTYWKRCYTTPYNVYANSWYSIICETYQQHRYQPTEKTAKVFLGGRIFIAFTCRHFLKNLKKLGFKTFDTIIDESYDDVEDISLRFDMAWQQVRTLSNSNHIENYTKVKDIIEHNRSLMLDLSFQLSDIENFIYKNAEKTRV